MCCMIEVSARLHWYCDAFVCAYQSKSRTLGSVMYITTYLRAAILPWVGEVPSSGCLPAKQSQVSPSPQSPLRQPFRCCACGWQSNDRKNARNVQRVIPTHRQLALQHHSHLARSAFTLDSRDSFYSVIALTVLFLWQYLCYVTGRLLVSCGRRPTTHNVAVDGIQIYMYTLVQTSRSQSRSRLPESRR